MTALERAIVDPTPVAGIGTRSPVDGLRRRGLGFVDVAAGASALWAVVVAMLLALVVATTVNQFTRRIAATGSLYTYVSRGLGTSAGFITGTACSSATASSRCSPLAGAAYYAGLLLGRFWPGAPDSPLLAIGLIAIMALVVLAVIILGIRLSTRVTLLSNEARILREPDASAMGRLLIAELLATGTALPPTVRSSRERLELIRAEVEALGYATQVDELVPGFGCIAVPVRDAGDTLVAGLALSAPRGRIERPAALLGLPHDGAQRLAPLLG